MERKSGYIILTAAARKYGVSQVRIWQLIRQKKLRSSTDGMQSVTVNAAQLDEYMRKHSKQLEVWQQPIKQKKNNESSTTKKSQFDYGKF